MVIAIDEPVFAGILVSLLSKYVWSGQCIGWLQKSCASLEEVIEEREGEKEDEEEVLSSANTTISDASVHVHCH